MYYIHEHTRISAAESYSEWTVQWPCLGIGRNRQYTCPQTKEETRGMPLISIIISIYIHKSCAMPKSGAADTETQGHETGRQTGTWRHLRSKRTKYVKTSRSQLRNADQLCKSAGSRKGRRDHLTCRATLNDNHPFPSNDGFFPALDRFRQGRAAITGG